MTKEIRGDSTAQAPHSIAGIAAHTTGETVDHPTLIGCVQHDCDKCKAQAENNAELLRTVRTLQAKLSAIQSQEPCAYQFQTVDGGWHPFLDDKHFANTKADGRWPIRALYAAPVAQKEST